MQLYFEVSSNPSRRLHQLVDNAPNTWTWGQLESECGNSTCEGKRSIAYCFGGICHRGRRCTAQAVASL